MSSIAPGRHRAPSRISVKPLGSACAALAVTSGLIVATPGVAQAQTATPSTPARTAVPAAALPQVTPSAGLSAAIAPARFLPTARSYTTYRWGSRGGQTRSIQRIVGAYADGIFGPRTHRAVQSWQRRHGLVADGIVGPITSRAMGLSSSRGSAAPSRSASRSSSSVLSQAARYTGVRYRYAGSTPSGFDCSGYVNYVFARVGVNLPRTAASIQRASTRTSSPRPGDLVFHNYPATHVGIYAGNGMFYDSGRSTNGTTLRRIFPGSVSYGRIG